jgi:hypothetical protein
VEYVFFPPLAANKTVATKCANVKIPFANAGKPQESIEIITWELTVRASILDPSDTFEEIFHQNSWKTVKVKNAASFPLKR